MRLRSAAASTRFASSGSAAARSARGRSIAAFAGRIQCRALSPREHPRLVILDNVDPSFTQSALDSMDPRKTLAVVIAKSGGTAETVSTFLIVRDWLEQALRKKAARRIVAVTTDGKGDLFELAQAEGYRVFGIPENVGGRFSVLSPVGLVPAALIGIDIRKLTRGAGRMTHALLAAGPGANIALRAALFHWLSGPAKRSPSRWRSLTPIISGARPSGSASSGPNRWARRATARARWSIPARPRWPRWAPPISTRRCSCTSKAPTTRSSPSGRWRNSPPPGKIPKRRFNLPAFDALAGQSLAKLIDAERRATAAALVENGRPNCTITLGRVDEEHLGAFLQMMEFQTAFMGELLDIDAFDQEGVELGKRFTYGLMGREGFEKYRRQFAAYEKKRKAL